MSLTEHLGTLRRDVGYALRALRRSPGFAAVAIATLSLGIGASTSIFTVVDAVLLRPLPFVESERLVMIQPTSGSRLSAAYLHDWRLDSRAFADIAGWHEAGVNLTGRGVPLEAQADRVTTNFFAMLGTPALLGRTFTATPDLSRVEPEVILSHGLWQRQYGGDPSVVGRSITIDGESFTIIGVMPAGLTIRTTELAESRAELWLPFRLMPRDRIGMGGFLHGVGRLAPGVTLDQAREDLSRIAAQIEAAHPSYSRDWGVRVVPLLEATVRDVRPILLVLFAGVGILLLIVCANVANLVLTRAVGRQTEFAIRLSIGATGGRLVRQFLTESLVLAVIGGSLGVLLAVWGTQWLVGALPAGVELPRTREIGVDLRILVFAVLVTIVTGVAFGVATAIHSVRSVSLSPLGNVTRGSSTSRSRHRVFNTLIVSQVSLAVVLLAGAGLLARSFWELTRVEPGFDAGHVLTMRTTLPAADYDTDERIRSFSSNLLERISALPGVGAAGSVSYLPLSNVAGASRFEIAGRPESRLDEQKFALTTVVGGRYFEAMGIPLLRGRLPGDADAAASMPVFVIDEQLARRYWPDADPIGAHVTWYRAGGKRMSGPIIGVVGSVRWVGMAADPWPSGYLWFPQDPDREITVVARTAGDPAAVANLMAAQVRAIDPNQPVAEMRTMQELVSADLARPRFTMFLLGAFAFTALLLAAIGLYGVIAFAVTERTREIGVRVALGAQYGDVLRLVMRRGMLLVGAGLAIGLPSALAAGRVIASLLYGITPGDPGTLLAVTCVLAGVALLAIYLPARRAARADPMVALRAE